MRRWSEIEIAIVAKSRSTNLSVILVGVVVPAVVVPVSLISQSGVFRFRLKAA